MTELIARHIELVVEQIKAGATEFGTITVVVPSGR